jgi:hypothetical protein
MTWIAKITVEQAVGLSRGTQVIGNQHCQFQLWRGRRTVECPSAQW